MIRIVVDDPALAKEVANGGDPLKLLCRKECDLFERCMQEQDPTFGPLAQFERMAVQSYLYQKIRGRIGASTSQGQHSEEQQDGKA
jgi:hypothetical protein